MSVSVEVVDSAFGRPAEGVPLTLLREVGAAWEPWASALTDDAGCVPVLETASARGRYRLALDLDKYFPALGVEPFQSRVEITFRVFEPGEEVRILAILTPSSSFVSRMVTERQAFR
jgi:5-hydroxyisourate hydrolase